MRSGMLRRTFAYLIDGFVIGALSGFLFRLGIGAAIDFSISMGNVYDRLVPSMISAGIYFLLFAYFNEGRTFGKALLHLQIESLDGGQLDREKMMFREGLKVILLPLSVFSFIICFFNQNRSSLHDLIMNTIVIKDI